MELLYIHLEDYLNFKDQEFNLSSKYKFEYTKQPNTRTLSIKRNPDYIEGFFDDECITNVTAVLGQNGAGKSHLLRFIVQHLSGRESRINGKVIFTYEAKGQIEIRQSIFSDLIIDAGPDLKTNKISLIRTDLDNDRSLENFSFLFYTNNFDLKIPSRLINTPLPGSEEYLDTEEYYTISTQAMISHDRNERGKSKKEVELESLDIFKLHELHRNLNFILSQRIEPTVNLDQLGFNLPDYLTIQIDETDQVFASGGKDFKAINNFFEINSTFFNPLNTSLKELFVNQLIRSIVYTMLRQRPDWLKETNRRLKEGSIHAYFTNDLHEWFASLTFKLQSKKDSNQSLSIEKLTQLPKLLTENIPKGIIKVDGNLNGKTLIIPIGADANPTINQLYSTYLATNTQSDFMHFGWRSLSSGEQSVLTLFSRFHYLKKKAPDLKQNVMILVDEGDLYFHPEWQRKYLKIFLDNIPAILGKERKYQFVFTANTPFLAADLPTDNIIFLEKKEEVNKEGEKTYTTQVAKKPNTKTFAANIHTLLADGFYLSSFLGEFAQQKIERIAEQLTSEDPDQKISEEEQTRIWKTIEAIGEPIIHERLKQLYDEKFGEAAQSIEARQEALRQEIARLEKLKNNRNDQN